MKDIAASFCNALLLTIVGSTVARAGPAPSAYPMRTDGSGCRMVVPADLGSGAVRWIGGCPRGSASGPGVLRVDRGAGGVALFAGTMRAGSPAAGYLDTGSASTSGPSLRFRGTDGLPTASRDEARLACTIASAGARAASGRLRSAGNMASARFYDGWARTLRRCTDRTE